MTDDEREARRIYDTPEWVTELLLRTHAPRRRATIVEPCAGRGSICKVLIDFGYRVSAVEIRPGACGAMERNLGARAEILNGDWFEQDWGRDGQDPIIANPPHKPTHEMLRHVESYQNPLREYVACLLPLSFLGTKSRARFHWRYPTSAIYPIADRVWDFAREMAWFVWDQRQKGQRHKVLWR